MYGQGLLFNRTVASINTGQLRSPDGGTIECRLPINDRVEGSSSAASGPPRTRSRAGCCRRRRSRLSSACPGGARWARWDLPDGDPAACKYVVRVAAAAAPTLEARTNGVRVLGRRTHFLDWKRFAAPDTARIPAALWQGLRGSAAAVFDSRAVASASAGAVAALAADLAAHNAAGGSEPISDAVPCAQPGRPGAHGVCGRWGALGALEGGLERRSPPERASAGWVEGRALTALLAARGRRRAAGGAAPVAEAGPELRAGGGVGRLLCRATTAVAYQPKVPRDSDLPAAARGVGRPTRTALWRGLGCLRARRSVGRLAGRAGQPRVRQGRP